MRLRSLVLLAAVALPSSVLAQGATLPGGATSLTETHGDWLVKCAIVPDVATPVCALSQEQAATDSGQRVLAIELQPVDGSAVGTLVMPFGLDLSHGVTLAIDEAAPRPALPFRTCVPGGCLVSLNFEADTIASLRTATALKLAAVADGGAPAPFSISLTGFASALDRTQALMAPAE